MFYQLPYFRYCKNLTSLGIFLPYMSVHMNACTLTRTRYSKKYIIKYELNVLNV